MTVLPVLPVLIVGAGPTGLTAAALLAGHGVRSVVVERQTEPYPLPRAVHLDDEAMRVLQTAGVIQAFRPLTRPGRGLRLLDAQHQVLAQFDRGTGPYGYPQANMFDQPDLERVLRAHLEASALVELRAGTELVSLQGRGPVAAKLRDGAGTTSLEVAAVLGCDGSDSTVRSLLGIGVDDLGFTERWLVVDGRCATPLEVWEGVHQVCDPARAATFMQIGEGRYRWEFRLCEGPVPEDIAPLLVPWTGGAEVQLDRCAEYVFRARLARQWRAGRVFLLGDAAHQTPPFIGQGLASGLRDAANLSWKLAAVLQGDADERVLDSYQAERRPHAHSLIRTAVVVGWAMTGGQDRAAAVRRRVLRSAIRIPGVTRILDRGTPALRSGPLVARRRLPHDVTGRLLPQVPTAGAGRLDDLLGTGFAVVGSGPQLQEVAAVVGARVVAVPELAAWLRRAKASAVVVRPDRVVMAVVDRSGNVRWPAGTDWLRFRRPR